MGSDTAVMEVLARADAAGVRPRLGGMARRESSGRLAFGLVAGGWELIAGLGGVVLAGLWAFTDHVMAYRNENLFQINPLALALALVLPFALRSSRAGRAAEVLALVVA